MTEVQTTLFPVGISPAPPKDFRYCEQAVSFEMERSLLTQFADLLFKEFQFRGFEGKRRIVSFGLRCKFLPANPVPPFLLEVYCTIQATAVFEHV